MRHERWDVFLYPPDFQGSTKAHQTHQRKMCFTYLLTLSPFNTFPRLNSLIASSKLKKKNLKKFKKKGKKRKDLKKQRRTNTSNIYFLT
jgi:hypothetical protein